MAMRQQRGQRNAHHHQETRDEAPEVDDGVARALHEVVRVRDPAADPVWQWRDHVCCDHEEREVVVEERRGEDHEEEADGEDLGALVLRVCGDGRLGSSWR